MTSEPARPAIALASVDLAGLAAAHGVVGAVLAVASHGERSAVTVGRTRPDGPPVERTTRFLIASVVKALVATVVAGVVDDGGLAVDTRVGEVLPGFGHPDVTVDHLLTHTSGLPDQWPAIDEGPDALALFVEGLARLPLHAAPGERYGYSNAGYAVLGRVLEVLHDRPFEQVMQQRLLAPLGSRATFRPTDLTPSWVAAGSSFDDAARTHGDMLPAQGARSMAPAGGRLYATADDLLSFGELHLAVEQGRPARRPLPGITALDAMRRTALEIPDRRHGRWMARGLVVDDAWGTPVLLHDGGALGQSAYLRIVPADRTVAVLLVTGGVPQTFHRAVFAELVPALLGRHPRPDVVADPAAQIAAERYVGRYMSPMSDVVVETAGGGAAGGGAPLVVSLHPVGGAVVGPLPLHAVDDGLFLTTLDGRPYSIAFETEPAVPCPALLAGLRRHVRAG